ncbi:MAG TPA: WD40 repeat domain-containing serine/threonine protein kinase [Trebonia sp.]|nr:WD40 repeat domain-containing serine/threonine protein kinase [Trebonia sp.]
MTDNFSTPPQQAHADLGAGSRIAGYVVEGQAGAGGMAVVYRARDEILGRLVAVKVLAPALAADQDFRTRFLRESRAIAAVDEPHVLPVYAAGEADGKLYIATRFVAGGDLATMLRGSNGPLAPDRVAALIEQVAAALDAAHAIGLVHRDVKPANILIENVAGRPEQAYLSDFGLIKPTMEATGLTATGIFMGTPEYCAPEQILGRPVDGRADQYALGCVTFCLLSGVLPYQRDETIATLFAHVKDPVPAVTAVRDELPTAVDAVLARAMAKDPAQRYASCGEFASALRSAVYSRLVQSVTPPLAWSAGPPTPPGAQVPAGWPTPPATAVPAAAGWQQAASSVAAGWQPPPGPYAFAPGQVPPVPGGPVRRHRNPAVLAGVAVAVVIVAAGIGTGVALSGGGSATSSSPTGPSTSVRVATFTAPAGGYISYAFFSLDGRLAVGQANSAHPGNIYVWDTASRKYVTTLTMPHGDPSQALCVTPDDKTLIAVDLKTYIIYRFDIASGQASEVRSVPEAAWNVSADGSTLANEVLAGNGIDVFNVATGAHREHLSNPTTATTVPNSLDLDSNGQELLISAKNDETYVVDVQTGHTLASFPYRYVAGGQLPVLSQDGATVYVPGNQTAPAQIWNVATRANITPGDSRWPSKDNGVVFSVDGLTAVTSPPGADYFDLWNISTRSHIARTVVPGGGNDVLESLGPGNSELLLGSSWNSAAKGSTDIYLYDVP